MPLFMQVCALIIFFLSFFVILHSTPIWAATKTTLCYVKNYCCTWRKIVIIVTASCSFSCSICLRVGLHHRLFLWVFVYICASGAFPCSGYCRWWGPVSCDVYDLASPLGRMGVCVGVCLRVSVWEDVISRWQSAIIAGLAIVIKQLG